MLWLKTYVIVIGDITLIKGQEILNNTEGVKQWKKSFW
jgi:hypothetical protein